MPFIIDTNFSIFNKKKIRDNGIRICLGGTKMVSYAPLWRTMEEKGITTYLLITKYHINPRTINNLKHNRGITVFTMERLCEILQCTPNDIVEFIQE